MSLRRIFAQNLKRMRTEKEFSQEALADHAGLDRTYISALERERYSATLDTIEKLSVVLGVEPQELLVRQA